MDIAKGYAARSKAGRDKGRYFLVLEVEGDYALIADGDLRKLSKPKRKKLMHLAATGIRFNESDITSDKSLYGAIKSRFCGADRQEEG